MQSEVFFVENDIHRRDKTNYYLDLAEAVSQVEEQQQREDAREAEEPPPRGERGVLSQKARQDGPHDGPSHRQRRRQENHQNHKWDKKRIIA